MGGYNNPTSVDAITLWKSMVDCMHEYKDSSPEDGSYASMKCIASDSPNQNDLWTHFEHIHGSNWRLFLHSLEVGLELCHAGPADPLVLRAMTFSHAMHIVSCHASTISLCFGTNMAYGLPLCHVGPNMTLGPWDNFVYCFVRLWHRKKYFVCSHFHKKSQWRKHVLIISYLIRLNCKLF